MVRQRKNPNKITITINKDVWKKVAQLKLDKDFDDYNEVIEYLLKQ